jgi:ATP-dependent RNA helicase DeaD
MPFPPTHPALARALDLKGYAEPTPVQAAVLQPEAAGRDLLVSAQTGSGKTVAYGLAVATTLLGEAERFEAPPAEPLCLVIAPTRELALQVQRELVWLYGPAGARVATCVGGMDIRREARALQDGCHIVAGTPGRLRDHLERGRLDPSKLRAVVLDEADEMLDLGFREDLTFILDAAPAERRTLLFSATIPRDIATLARQYQRDAHRIDTVDQSQPHGDIAYRAVRIAPNEVEHAVVNVLRFFEARGAMVFCHTREMVRKLHGSLLERGFSAVALSGELSQSERNHALQALRDGRARVCVATDVAARGIDLPDLGLVIHADLPNDRDTLLHRSGRTGRAGRKGICVLLVPFNRRRKAEGLIQAARVDVEWGPPPSADEIRTKDQERLVQDQAFTDETTEEDLTLARALLAERSAEEVAAALVRFHRARLPAPEELYDGGPERDTRGLRDAREPREPRPPRAREERTDEPMVWFKMSVGRRNNADPRWLLPVICRLGHVTKHDIGPIRIFDRETKFGIKEASAARFAQAATRGPNDEDIRVEPVDPSFVVPKGKGPRPARDDRGPREAHPPRAPRPPREHAEARPARRDDEAPRVQDGPSERKVHRKGPKPPRFDAPRADDRPARKGPPQGKSFASKGDRQPGPGKAGPGKKAKQRA